MQVLGCERIELVEVDILALYLERAVIHAMPPFGAGVAETAHLEAPERFEGDLFGSTA